MKELESFGCANEFFDARQSAARKVFGAFFEDFDKFVFVAGVYCGESPLGVLWNFLGTTKGKVMEQIREDGRVVFRVCRCGMGKHRDGIVHSNNRTRLLWLF